MAADPVSASGGSTRSTRAVTHEFEPHDGGPRMTLRVQVHDPPLYERMIDRLEGKGPDRLVHNRLQRIAQAVEGSTAGT